MKVSDLKNSRFLTKHDCDPPVALTISGVEQVNVATSDQAPENRWCLLFEEDDVKPFVLNSTNGGLIQHYLGSDDSDDWVGKQITLYHDPTIQFAGKLVGGIRVRKHDEEGATSDIPW